MKVGDRVQLHPSTDAWMRGDRYGEVTAEKVKSTRLHDVEFKMYRVRLDKSGRQFWFFSTNLLEVL